MRVWLILVVSIVIVLLIGCTAEECEIWGWDLPECASISPVNPEPTPTPIFFCLPELKSTCDWAGCKYEMVYDCE